MVIMDYLQDESYAASHCQKTQGGGHCCPFTLVGFPEASSLARWVQTSGHLLSPNWLFLCPAYASKTQWCNP